MNEPIGCALCGGNDHNADECKRFAVVPIEPTPAMLDVAVSHALMVSLSGDYNWSAYMRDVWLRMVSAAAPAQGQQVDHIEQDLGMAQHARDSAELRRLCAERDEAKRQVAALRQHKTDYMEAAEVTRKALESELTALKAQQSAHVSVPRELLERTICRLTHGHEHDKAVRELRALLNGGEANG